ncbi:hypothetical protein FQR65_LT02910 [Abscondita terminalis]|nr:hypothetical protein FQR65_LT02910 [Abscondita terminalis]
MSSNLFLVNRLMACFDAIEFLEQQNKGVGEIFSQLKPSQEFQFFAIDIKQKNYRLSSQRPPTHCVIVNKIVISESSVDVASTVKAVFRFSDQPRCIDDIYQSLLELYNRIKNNIINYVNAV